MGDQNLARVKQKVPTPGKILVRVKQIDEIGYVRGEWGEFKYKQGRFRTPPV